MNQRIGISLLAGNFLHSRNWQFQTRLGSSNGKWSAPTTLRSFEFSNLSEGDYRFEARTINPEGMTSNTANFTFTPAVDGIYQFDFTVTDDNGGTNTKRVTVTANNAARLMAPRFGPTSNTMRSASKRLADSCAARQNAVRIRKGRALFLSLRASVQVADSSSSKPERPRSPGMSASR